MNWEKTLIYQNSSLGDAINIIDKSNLQIALVVNDKLEVLGILTDGDARRALLKGANLKSNLSKWMNKKPYLVKEGNNKNLLEDMKIKRIHQIPIVNKENKVIDLIHIDQLLQPQKKENYIFIMAGGLGKRLLPLTENIPKPMIQINNKPILLRIIEKFVDQGFYKFFISVNYKSDIIKNFFGDGSNFNIEIKYIEENKKLGTAGSLSLLNDYLKEDLIVINGDLITDIEFKNILDFHESEKSKFTVVVRQYNYQVPFGVVNIIKNVIHSIDEKPIISNFVNAGIYVLSPSSLKFLKHNKKIDMTDYIKVIMEKGIKVNAFPLWEKWIDIGRKDELFKAIKNDK